MTVAPIVQKRKNHPISRPATRKSSAFPTLRAFDTPLIKIKTMYAMTMAQRIIPFDIRRLPQNQERRKRGQKQWISSAGKMQHEIPQMIGCAEPKSILFELGRTPGHNSREVCRRRSRHYTDEPVTQAPEPLQRNLRSCFFYIFQVKAEPPSPCISRSSAGQRRRNWGGTGSYLPLLIRPDLPRY